MRHPLRPLAALPLALALLVAQPFAAGAEDSPWRAAQPLTQEDRADLERIEDYLNGIETVSGRFVQITSTGHFSQGDIALKRPGQLRFEYDEPVPLLLISDGHTMVMYDKSIESASQIPLDQSPLWFLTRDPIAFEGAVDVLAVERDKGTILVSLMGSSALGDAQVDLVFVDSPLQLHRWRVIDEEGYEIQVALLEPRFDVALDDAMFDYRELLDMGFETQQGNDR
jgi:outer membrane lipoprotein-sorting protein